MTALNFYARTWVLALVWVGAAHVALADGGGRRMPARVPPAYIAECAGCHVAYPPGLLPASSWQRVMDGLDEHYGTDATLDHEVVKQLNEWLRAHAGTYKRVRAEPPPPEDRITRSRWFARKHDDIAPSVYRRPAIKSAANCMACHDGAQRGNFEDDFARIPK